MKKRKKKIKEIITNDGSGGGIFEGPSHKDGGIPVTIEQTGEKIEVEEIEPLLNPDSMSLKEQYSCVGEPMGVLSAVNQLSKKGNKFSNAPGVCKIINSSKEQGDKINSKAEIDNQKSDKPIVRVGGENVVVPVGSAIVNKTSPKLKKRIRVSGTPEQIASEINTIGKNGVDFAPGASIEYINVDNKYLYGGVAYKSPIYSKLKQAKELIKDHSPLYVWKKTGCILGCDNKWRFEIDDSKSKIKIPLKDISANFKKGDYIYSLEDILQHEDFYYLYPEAKKIIFVINTNHRQRDLLLAASGTNKQNGKFYIILTIKTLEAYEIIISNFEGSQRLRRQFNAILLHEIQHYLQKRHSFREGVGVDQITEELQRKIKDARNRANLVRGIERDKFLDEAEDIKKNLDYYIGERYINQPSEQEAWDVYYRANLSKEKRDNIPPSYFSSQALKTGGKMEDNFSHGGTIRKVKIDSLPHPIYATVQEDLGDKIRTDKGIYSKQDVIKEFNVPKQFFAKHGMGKSHKKYIDFLSSSDDPIMKAVAIPKYNDLSIREANFLNNLFSDITSLKKTEEGEYYVDIDAKRYNRILMDLEKRGYGYIIGDSFTAKDKLFEFTHAVRMFSQSDNPLNQLSSGGNIEEREYYRNPQPNLEQEVIDRINRLRFLISKTDGKEKDFYTRELSALKERIDSPKAECGCKIN